MLEWIVVVLCLFVGVDTWAIIRMLRNIVWLRKELARLEAGPELWEKASCGDDAAGV